MMLTFFDGRSYSGSHWPAANRRVWPGFWTAAPDFGKCLHCLQQCCLRRPLEPPRIELGRYLVVRQRLFSTTRTTCSRHRHYRTGHLCAARCLWSNTEYSDHLHSWTIWHATTYTRLDLVVRN